MSTAVAASYGRAPLAFALPLAPLALFSFWDMYVGGVRPFDLAGVAIVTTIAAIQVTRTFNTRRVALFLGLLVLTAAAGARGMLGSAEAIKPVAGVLVAAWTALLVSMADWDAEEVRRGMGIVISIHIAAFFGQLAIYLATGTVINFHGWLGITPRLESIFFRPAGLFQEPAHYALAIFGMTVLYRLIGGRSGWIQLLALGSLVASVSLWGIAAVFVFLLLFYPLIGAVVGGAALTIGFTLLTTLGSDWVVTERIILRIERMGSGSDGSANSRYSGLFSGQVPLETIWFGNGISNDYLATGSSSISFLLSGVGLAGLLVLALFWILAAPEGRRLRGGMALLFMLLAASQWTMVWWWVWIAFAVTVPVVAGERR